jgi:hypothetical protein
MVTVPEAPLLTIVTGTPLGHEAVDCGNVTTQGVTQLNGNVFFRLLLLIV